MPKFGLTQQMKSASFRLFGRRIPNFPMLKQSCQKSGLGMLYETYMSVMFLSCVVSFFLTLVVGFVVHKFLFLAPIVQSITAVFTLSFISVLLVLVGFIAYPLLRVRKRKAEIEANLVYTVGYMGVLSAGGVSIERAFGRVIEVEPRAAIRELAMRIIANVRMFGLDVASSIEDVRVHSSSDTFAKLLMGVVNTIKTSGDLKSLMIFETNRLLSSKREQLKKTLSALVALAELYVTAMVMAPITFIIMLTILSVLGTTQFGLSPAMQLNLIVFFGLPVICIVFIVVLDGVLPKEG